MHSHDFSHYSRDMDIDLYFADLIGCTTWDSFAAEAENKGLEQLSTSQSDMGAMEGWEVLERVI